MTGDLTSNVTPLETCHWTPRQLPGSCSRHCPLGACGGGPAGAALLEGQYNHSVVYVSVLFSAQKPSTSVYRALLAYTQPVYATRATGMERSKTQSRRTYCELALICHSAYLARHADDRIYRAQVPGRKPPISSPDHLDHLLD